MKGRLMRALALAALVPPALASCGGSTKTVTAEPQAGAETLAGTSSSTNTTATAPSSTGAGGGSGGGSPAQGTTPSRTRTATEPQFDQSQSSSQEAEQAAAVVRTRGYTADDLSEYHPQQTLRALVGTRSGSADGYGQQVFFFVDGRFIGTDTKEPSASLKVVSQGDTEAVVAYRLYRPGDPLSSPSGGQAVVHFQLNNGRLVALGTIPPVHSGTGASRL
ncbi:MAG TPA: LppP/LprE family lipoprotein [Solirubrobacteraceae bacterium]|nr:LppP/LprE family lipoprotein [Solirubrobacteraceae bacterium]